MNLKSKFYKNPDCDEIKMKELMNLTEKYLSELLNDIESSQLSINDNKVHFLIEEFIDKIKEKMLNNTNLCEFILNFYDVLQYYSFDHVRTIKEIHSQNAESKNG